MKYRVYDSDGSLIREGEIEKGLTLCHDVSKIYIQIEENIWLMCWNSEWGGVDVKENPIFPDDPKYDSMVD